MPWLTLTSALFTENLSYPLFWWMVLATAQAVWRPSPLRDLLALASVGAAGRHARAVRGRLLRLPAGAARRGLWRADGASGVAASARERGRRHRPWLSRWRSLILVAGVGCARPREGLNGQAGTRMSCELLGSYSDVVIRSGLPPNMGEGLLVELHRPRARGRAAAGDRLARLVRAGGCRARDCERRWVYLFSCGVVIVVFMVLTVYSQGGYLGALTEERYFFYVIPAFWLGTFAALEERSVRAGELLGCAARAGGAVRGDPVPVAAERGDRIPRARSSRSSTHVLPQWLDELGLTGLTLQDALALLTLLGGPRCRAVVVAALRARGCGGRSASRRGGAAAIAGYAFAVIDGKVPGIVGRTGGSVARSGWVDSHAARARSTVARMT